MMMRVVGCSDSVEASFDSHRTVMATIIYLLARPSWRQAPNGPTLSLAIRAQKGRVTEDTVILSFHRAYPHLSHQELGNRR